MTDPERPFGEWLFGLNLAGILGLTGVLSVTATQHVDSVLIFGGTECETVNGLYSCVGYPPSGVAIIALVSVVIVGALNKIWMDIHGN